MKSRNLFIGILVLFTGVVALLSVLGSIEFHWSIVWKLWPLFLIIAGIAILPINDYVKGAILVATLGIGCLLYQTELRHYEGNVVTRFFNRHFSQWDWDRDDDDDAKDEDRYANASDFLPEQHFSEPFRSVERASMEVDFGAGELEIMSPCAEMVKADIESDFVKYSFKTEESGEKAAFYLSGKGQANNLHKTKDNKNDIELALCAHPIWDFNLDMGAASADLDFSPYKMENIEVNGGACKLDLKLGDNGCDSKVTINTGASDIDISVPSTMDCEILLESAITGKEFQGFEKVEKGLWRSLDYGNNAHRITIQISCAMSNISVERY